MPSELRHLLFRAPEVVQALKEYYRRTGQRLPAGHVVKCGPESDGAGERMRFRITVNLDAPLCGTAMGESSWQDVVVEGPVLAAALILHCRDRRIPLPASADKSLQLFGNQVCLLVTINPRQDDLPKIGEMQL